MRKSAKLSLALALMMGTTAGVNMVAPSSASAEISDKFRMEVNGYCQYSWNPSQLGMSDTYKSDGTRGYWTHMTRLQLNYYQDKNTMFQARLHSGYDSIVKNVKNSNESGAYFDQSFLQVKDRKANVIYTLGKKGAYLGQGLIHNSTGNITGGQISFGNWYDPTCLQLIYGNKKNGSNFFAANFTHNITKPWQLSLTYINHDVNDTHHAIQPDDVNPTFWAGKGKTGQGYSSVPYGYDELHLLSVGSHVKAKTFTVQGEYIRNLSDKVANGISTKVYTDKNKDKDYANPVPTRTKDSRRAWYVEVFTGPTSDMTSGLPLQKPGTNVWSLKYQDVGANAVDDHNPTFCDDAKGFRLNYGHTFKKGLAADIAVARMKDKGQSDYNDKHNGKMKNIIMAEVSYKFH